MNDYLHQKTLLGIVKGLKIKERQNAAQLFNDKINILINQTPSGNLRNELSELNILFNIVNEIDKLLIE